MNRTSLHGDGYAVGYVVGDMNGNVMEVGRIAAPMPDHACQWVRDNVPPVHVTHGSLLDLRSAFWATWRRLAAQGCKLVSDVAWPVEANFLSACVRDAAGARDFEGPYPLLDVAVMLDAHGEDPDQARPMIEGEIKHDPMHDAMASYRVLVRLNQQ